MKPLNMTKVQSHVMLILHNMKMILLNVKKKTTKCDKSTVTCEIGTTQCEDKIIKCEKKKWELSNMTKVQLQVMLVPYNMRMT